MSSSPMSWADGPMVALDLETTDIDPRRDRLVTAAVVVIRPSRPGERPEVTPHTWLADPGVDIPAEATAINGITTEQAQREGRSAAEVIAEVAALLTEVWTATTPLCVFNAAFDLTMLDAELERHHGRSLMLSGPVIDPLCIDRHLDPERPGPRNLGAACAHYQVRLEGAHTSVGDALAAARLAWRLAKTHPNGIGTVAPHILHSHQARWFREHEFAYADKLDYRVRRMASEGGDAADIDRLKARAADARAAARSWPLLPAATDASRPTRRRLPPRPGGPANSHASWTPDQEATLRNEWLAADPAAVAETLRKDIAERHGRSPGAIRSRLLRLMCDPELPGHTCDEDRAAQLKQIYDAEYGRR
ncbi:exonuclease domain-containing protein [Prauserella endophytica]|uniref:DNA polymerase III subunit epsilon n=1 Tax=Prauserella endophytica TaxID=1592324 RepID=A0ABY2RT27_9PSEU|nr:exonuclease domain-containing protein [Prauserella endophytica]TKG59278.1 DNA polymerase III subunit epsilon [Prauserella endophytica]